MGQGSQGGRPVTETRSVDSLPDAGDGGGFGDTTARQEKPLHLMDLPNASDAHFGDTTAKQARPPDVYAPGAETETIKGRPLPDIPAKDEAVTIKDNHKKTMQSAVAVDLVSSPDTQVPSTLDDDEPEPDYPKRPRVGPPTLASPGVPQAEWDSAAYPHIAAPAPLGAPPAVGGPPPHMAPYVAPMGYAPPHASGSGDYAQAQPRAPLPPTYRIKRDGGGSHVAIILVAIGFAFAVFAAGLLLFVSKRMTPAAASARGAPPTEIAPGGSAVATASAPIVVATSTTPPLQHESQSPPATAAPPPPTAPRATAAAPGKPGKGPKGPKAPALAPDR